MPSSPSPRSAAKAISSAAATSRSAPPSLRSAGLANLLVVATPGKLASLHNQTLRVDTGDTDLDRQLCGYRRVVTGYGSEAICRVTT